MNALKKFTNSAGWLLSLLLLLFSIQAKASGLSGTYTINPSGSGSTNYKTFTAAVSALSSSGVSGAVVFNVSSATYSEQITIGAITGASATNTITFQSAAADSNSVIVSYSSTSNGTLTFDGASYVYFHGITFQNTYGGYPGSAVYFESGSQYDSISHCVARSSYQYAYTVWIYGTSGANDYITINECAVHGGEAGIWSYNYYSPYQHGIVITGNTVDSFYYYGIWSYYDDSITISKNLITKPLSSGYDYFGIYAYNTQSGSIFIYDNKIILPGNAQYDVYGIYFDYTPSLSSSVPALVYNNFVSITGGSTATCRGIDADYYSQNITFDYNNINITNTNTNSAGIYNSGYYGSNGLIYKDNISANYGGGYAVYVASSSYVDSMNFNDYFVDTVTNPGSNLGNWSGSTEANLSDWQSASSMDDSSKSVDPIYASNTDLSPNADSLYHRGVPIYGVTLDINGKLRNTTNPCIGAVEFVLTHNDAGVISIDSPTAGFCAGTLPVYATFKDFGSDSLKSVTIGWSVNGTAKTSYSWSGAIGQGQTAQIKLGSLSFAANTLYTIKVYTSLPNGKTDQNTSNDTTINGVSNGMGGTYTINADTSKHPDFTSFTAALNAISTRGLCGSVIFNVGKGVYKEALSINSITGVSAAKTVTFQSASLDSSKVILSSSNNYAVTLNGASYITFNEITMQDSGTSGGIYIEGGASYNTFSHCIIRANYQYAQVIYMYGYNNPNNYNTINNCGIYGGEYGIYCFGSYSTPYQTGNVFTNNIIDSFGGYYGYGIQTYYDDSITISKNIITTPAAPTYYLYGIYVYNPQSGGIYIYKNKIVFPVSAPYTTAGIYTDYTYNLSSSNPGMVYNNFIAMTGGTNAADGIYAGYYSENINFDYNNINVTNTNSSSAGIYNYAYYGGTGLIYKNNISANTGGGYAIYVYSSTYFDSSNFNDYFVDTTNSNWISGTTGLGYWGGTIDSTLTEWQSTTGGQDDSSISANPLYTSATNLHPYSVALFHKGTPISGIIDDIYGTLRNTVKPDIGAVEFTPQHNDAGIIAIDSPTSGFCAGTLNEVITFGNFGLDTIKSITLYFSVNGGTPSSTGWTGTLYPGQSATVKVGSAAFSTGTTYNLKAYTYLPNGLPDGNHSNDTGTASVSAGLSGTYTIGGTSPDYATFGAAIADLRAKGFCGSVIFNVRDGVYNENLNITAFSSSSPTATVTFQSASGDSSKVTLVSSSGYPLTFDGCSYITFRTMRIQGSGYSGAVDIANTSTYKVNLSICRNSLYVWL